jgi:hypothetical protein
VYMAGRGGYNIAKDVAYKSAAAFKAEMAKIAQVESITISGTSVRIICKEQKYVEVLLRTEMFLDKEVKVTRPRGVTQKAHKEALTITPPTSSTWVKGVLKRVPLDIAVEDIQHDTGAIWCHRITKWVDRKQVPTKAVIVAFESGSELPKSVTLGLMTLKVVTYIPLPMRCNKCQKYGHKGQNCRETAATCPKCAGKHTVEHSDATERKCVNCGGKHSAAYKGCEKYEAVSDTLVHSSHNEVSYSEAAKTLAVNKRVAKKAKRQAELKEKAAVLAATVNTSALGGVAPTPQQEESAAAALGPVGVAAQVVTPIGSGAPAQKRNRRANRTKTPEIHGH